MRNIPKDLIDSNTYTVTYVVYLDDKGDKHFFYIAVRRDKILSFQRAVLEGDFDAEDYGIILEDGEGEAPEEVKERMKIMYNCHHADATPLEEYTPPNE